ncbi:hypothetical protein [Oerskovia flava]|uniref:hypothetical protein n=1 Tax=Oerskovia flava TaxID=2986422 RepID=UPI00223EAF2C|nr:hypothetical protein [Oerskovia sp. JB1-3-2]
MSHEPTARDSFDDDVTALLDYEHAVTDVLALVGRDSRRTGPTYPRGDAGRGVLAAHLVSDCGRLAVRIVDEHPTATVVAALLPLDGYLTTGQPDVVLCDADHVLCAAGYHRTTAWDAGDTGGLPLALVEPLPDLAAPPWARATDVLPLDDDGRVLVTFERSFGTAAGVDLWVGVETVVDADTCASSGPFVGVQIDRDTLSAMDARDLAARLTRAADVVDPRTAGGAA